MWILSNFCFTLLYPEIPGHSSAMKCNLDSIGGKFLFRSKVECNAFLKVLSSLEMGLVAQVQQNFLSNEKSIERTYVLAEVLFFFKLREYFLDIFPSTLRQWFSLLSFYKIVTASSCFQTPDDKLDGLTWKIFYHLHNNHTI